MPSVHFLPQDITVEVPEGTLIHEAAIKAGIEDLHLPCGAKGTCGRCLVELVSGHAEQSSSTRLGKALGSKGLVVACQTKVHEDLTVRVGKPRESGIRVVGDSHLLISEEHLPDASSLFPLFHTQQITVPPATIEEHYSDWQRVVRELTRAAGPVPVTTGVEVLRRLAGELRAQDGKLTMSICERDGGLRVLDIQAGHVTHRAFGLAIDVGTTTVAMQLVDLRNGHVIGNQTSYNGQIGRGADIISRIDYARTPEKLSELREMVLGTLNGLIASLQEDAGVEGNEIRAAFIAGNTTMTHLLLGLPPRYIRESPYVPTVNTVPMLSGAEVGLAIRPDAVVSFAPGVGSYVGGDITAGLLCTELHSRSDEVYLFLDIGTNGEIVLGNAEWMVTCACSAGPAFEGSGIKCGMRAAEGAIEYIEIDPSAFDVRYDVIGGGAPAGICGSGLICLLGELFVRGIIDQSGQFNMELPTERLVKFESTRGFVLEWGANTQDGRDLIITEPDIENLMRTKAAIYAACTLILSNVGLEWDAISQIFIAGGFGRYIQVEDAILIGLLPDLPHERFRYIGNSSLTGAYIALLSREQRQRLAEIAGGMTYIDLSSDPRYMDNYLGAMFLPHTDISQFSSVARRLAR